MQLHKDNTYTKWRKKKYIYQVKLGCFTTILRKHSISTISLWYSLCEICTSLKVADDSYYIVCLWRLRKKYDNIGCDTCVDFRVNRVEIYMLILAENEGNRPRSPLQNKPSGRVLNSSWNTRALFSFIDIESAATSTWSIQYNLNAFFSMIFWCVFGETFLQGFKRSQYQSENILAFWSIRGVREFWNPCSELACQIWW